MAGVIRIISSPSVPDAKGTPQSPTQELGEAVTLTPVVKFTPPYSGGNAMVSPAGSSTAAGSVLRESKGLPQAQSPSGPPTKMASTPKLASTGSSKQAFVPPARRKSHQDIAIENDSHRRHRLKTKRLQSQQCRSWVAIAFVAAVAAACLAMTAYFNFMTLPPSIASHLNLLEKTSKVVQIGGLKIPRTIAFTNAANSCLRVDSSLTVSTGACAGSSRQRRLGVGSSRRQYGLKKGNQNHNEQGGEKEEGVEHEEEEATQEEKMNTPDCNDETAVRELQEQVAAQALQLRTQAQQIEEQAKQLREIRDLLSTGVSSSWSSSSLPPSPLSSSPVASLQQTDLRGTSRSQQRE